MLCWLTGALARVVFMKIDDQIQCFHEFPSDLLCRACQRKNLLPFADDCVALSQMPLPFDFVRSAIA